VLIICHGFGPNQNTKLVTSRMWINSPFGNIAMDVILDVMGQWQCLQYDG